MPYQPQSKILFLGICSLNKLPGGDRGYATEETLTSRLSEDVAALLRVLQRLVDAGNTVVVIEHHPDVMKNADYIIDLGPGAGDKGGYVVAKGTPETVAAEPKSLTGQHLKELMKKPVSATP